MRGFYRFLFVRFLSAFGTQVVLFAAPLIVFKFTGSMTYAGLAFAIEWGIGMMALPIAGVLSDRIGGSRLYSTVDFVRFVTCVVCFFLLWNFPESAFIIVSLCGGILAFCLNSAFVALETVVPKYLPANDIHKGQSLLQAADQLSLLLGPAVATGLIVITGEAPLFLLAAAAFVASFASMFFFKRISEVSEQVEVRSPLSDMKAGAAILFSEPRLILLCCYGLFVNVVYCALLSLGAAIVTGTYALDATFYGVLSVVTGLTTIGVMVCVPIFRNHFSMQSLGIVATIGVAIGGVLVSLEIGYWVFAIGFAMVISMDAVAGVYLRTERVKFIPAEHLGKTLGIMVLVIVMSYPLAGLLVAAFSERIGVGPLMLILSVVCLLGNAVVLRLLATWNATPSPNAAKF
ncbi:MAG: MFS transporter [Pseudoruegeria sp.]